MLFHIDINTNNPILANALSTKNLLLAKSFIINFPFGASERMLDSYLRTNFKQGLVECCLAILFKLTRSSNGSGEIIYTFIDDYWDTLAQLITCGIENIPGSRILVEAIGSIYKE